MSCFSTSLLLTDFSNPLLWFNNQHQPACPKIVMFGFFTLGSKTERSLVRYIPQISDPALTHVTHIMVDEIHERGRDEDFLLIVLRDILPKRPDLRLVSYPIMC
jgi:hypothetical protein